MHNKQVEDSVARATHPHLRRWPYGMKTLISQMSVLSVVGLVFLGCSGDSDMATPQGHNRSQPVVKQWTWEEVSEVVTNGMPIADVIAVLGTNYDLVKPFSTVAVPPLQDEDKRISLWYDFEGFRVSVRTSAPLSGDTCSVVCVGLGTVTLMEKGGQQP